MYQLDLRFLFDAFKDIVIDNFYHSKIVSTFKKIFNDSLMIETSVEGQMIYDIFAYDIRKHKKKYLTNYQLPAFKDFYQHPKAKTFKLVVDIF